MFDTPLIAASVIANQASQVAAASAKEKNEPAKFKVGQLVSMRRWDCHRHARHQIGTPARIEKIETGVRCESGTMVEVCGVHSGVTERLDSNWLKPYEE